MNVDALLRLNEGLAQQQRKEDAEESLGNTALFDSTLDGEGFRGGAIILNSASCVLVKRDDDPQELRRTSNSLQKCKQA